MRITAQIPQPPPKEIVMTFPKAEGWAIAAALAEYAERHPEAVRAALWNEWATRLDEILRSSQ